MHKALGNLTESQKAQFEKHYHEHQAQSSLRMFNNLVEHCFDKCVMTSWGGGFSSKNLAETESKCMSQCAEKYMKVMQRSGFRFSENQAIDHQLTQQGK